MATTDFATIQSNIKTSNVENITDYALFLGGTNVTHEVLKQYDPLKTGYGRLFMVRKPAFLDGTNPTQLTNFKHILEYGNTQIQGLTDISVNFAQVTGGYVGRSFEVPTHATDGMSTFTVTVYEFSGSPVRELLHSWINGSHDLMSGFKHFNGLDDDKTYSTGRLPRILANETAEFIYVATDDTGEEVEYACLLANCFPGGLNTDAFNYSSGNHDLVTTDIEFHCVKYESIQINKVAKQLLNKFKILSNSLNFYSGISSEMTDELGLRPRFGYNYKTGKLDEKVRPDYQNDNAAIQNSYRAMYNYRNTPINITEDY